MSVLSGLLDPTNPEIDFMQLVQLVNINSGLSYADDIEKTTQEAVRQILDLITTDPSQVDEEYLTKVFANLLQHRMGVLTHGRHHTYKATALLPRTGDMVRRAQPARWGHRAGTCNPTM